MITPEQMFGVNLMVHSYVKVSGVPVTSKTNHTTTFKSGRAVQQQRAISAHNWRLARGLFFLFAFLVLFSGFTFMHTSASTDQVVPISSEELVISVDSGDTLWKVAKTYKKASMDTREAVHYLLKRNNLSSSELKIGQTLIIPSRIMD
ncbi:LysM peptidoglycan-binding domain-containing protein [Cohnella sp.]|uniref:cell division suppressor protein YneA n=1 Tax=Cohnella sp. TaxID=1883426 RepID=UPI00356AC0E9